MSHVRPTKGDVITSWTPGDFCFLLLLKVLSGFASALRWETLFSSVTSRYGSQIESFIHSVLVVWHSHRYFESTLNVYTHCCFYSLKSRPIQTRTCHGPLTSVGNLPLHWTGFVPWSHTGPCWETWPNAFFPISDFCNSLMLFFPCFQCNLTFFYKPHFIVFSVQCLEFII